MDETNKDREAPHSNSRVWVALTLMVVGAALLVRQVGYNMPYWLFTWPMLLIVIGVFMGFNHGFRGGAWAVLIIVGGFFLIDDAIPGLEFHRFLWPFVILAVGLLILIRPRRHRDWHWKHWDRWQEKNQWQQSWGPAKDKVGNFSSENYIDATAVFGGIHKTIVSKDFKGGDVTILMGGAEINLSQADIIGTARLDITQIMGGSKLIVPPHWEIRSQMTSVFGNIEDKRQESKVTNPDKVLIIDGTSIFGGIEIRNY
ncbi:MAG TPA: LiaF domain-containing protein [Puia sp.]|nr:LiaF domain-containing protein [Puia sp.]